MVRASASVFNCCHAKNAFFSSLFGDDISCCMKKTKVSKQATVPIETDGYDFCNKRAAVEDK